ncbi:hypothetical protein N9R48_03055, partial [Rickettsiales bacterium]|nr:hypothetical protein [Rickettsiales bacterium]
ENMGRKLNKSENNFLEEVTKEKSETSFSFELAISLKYNYSNIVHLILESSNDQNCKELILAKDSVSGNCLLHYAGQKESSHMLEIILFHLKRSNIDIDNVTTHHLNIDNKSPKALFSDANLFNYREICEYLDTDNCKKICQDPKKHNIQEPSQSIYFPVASKTKINSQICTIL